MEQTWIGTQMVFISIQFPIMYKSVIIPPFAPYGLHKKVAQLQTYLFPVSIIFVSLFA